MEALADKGWLFAGANEYYLFWERPGYWLRVSTFEDGWRASILPPAPKFNDTLIS